MARTCGVLYIFTFKCASRHNAVHLFDISCFAHFDFQMCFAPQVRARFPHRNFQKWSKHGVIVHFDFQMCFAPQARALFPHCGTSQLPKVAQTWCGCAFWLPHVLGVCTFASLLWPAGSAPAALASLLIDPPQPQNIGKNIGKTLFATFLPFRAPASSLFWLSPCVIFSLLTFTLSQLLLKRLSLSIRSYCRKFSFQTSIDHFFMASTARNTHRMEQLQNTLVRGHQLCTQLSILDGSLAELLLFWSTSTLGEIL